MFKLITKQSPKKYVEQARTLRVDSTTLKCLGETLLETGESFSVVTTRGISSVYSGDLSADGVAGGQGVPLVTMEYKTSAHTAYVKNGNTGELIMMLIREPRDNSWHEEGKTYARFGNATEARLWFNGRPVGVNYSETLVDIAPKAPSEEKAQMGASMIELVKEKVGNSLRLYKLKGDGSKGTELAAYTRVKNGPAVFRLLAKDVLDPVVAIVMAWFTTIDNK
eukprot:TRINITY_DN4973_c0_g1_i2.p1 TRINITY_DN4973_c0_g1~~TRINITY_DN4973_c0_g1_i2.p1  ORF type:complete len:223 (-),score=15.11 TRINITY_DN4973_c0_g1_i2:207-875(-)